MFLAVVCVSGLFLSLTPANAQILDLNEGAPCEALGGESGTCQLITDCYNPGDFKKEHPPICTFQGKVPVICCPDSTGIKEEDFRFKLGSNKAAQYCKNHTASCEKHRQEAVAGATRKSFANNFMAIIGYGPPQNQVWKCSGTLITTRFVMSAASCAELKDLGPASWAKLGASQNNGGGLVSQIVERIAYPEYKDGSVYNDLALFLLHDEIPFNSMVGPVCLHNGREVKGDVSSIVWGKYQNNANGPELIESKSVVDNQAKCQSMAPKGPPFRKGVLEPLMFCASVEDYSPANCKVETAGGPIIVREKGLCLATQIGIASYRKESCGETNFPTVYTRISNYLSWIEGIIFHVLYT